MGSRKIFSSNNNSSLCSRPSNKRTRLRSNRRLQQGNPASRRLSNVQRHNPRTYTMLRVSLLNLSRDRRHTRGVPPLNPIPRRYLLHNHRNSSRPLLSRNLLPIRLRNSCRRPSNRASNHKRPKLPKPSLNLNLTSRVHSRVNNSNR